MNFWNNKFLIENTHAGQSKRVDIHQQYQHNILLHILIIKIQLKIYIGHRSLQRRRHRTINGPRVNHNLFARVKSNSVKHTKCRIKKPKISVESANAKWKQWPKKTLPFQRIASLLICFGNCMRQQKYCVIKCNEMQTIHTFPLINQFAVRKQCLFNLIWLHLKSCTFDVTFSLTLFFRFVSFCLQSDSFSVERRELKKKLLISLR